MAEAVNAVLKNTSVEEAKKWKLTSMSKDEAVKKFGEKNVRLGRKNRRGDDTVEVYVESVDEEMDPTDHVSKKDGKFVVVNKDGKTVKSFDSKDKADEYAKANHDKLMEEAEEVQEAKKLSSKEEAVVLKLMSSTKTAQEAAKKVEKQMKIPYKEALEIVRNVMKQYESVEESTDLEEAFKRIPGNMINNELPRAAKDLESVIRGLKSGNDFNEKAFNKVLAALNSIKKSAKSFKSEDDVTKPYQYRADPRYKSEQYESVEEVALDEASKEGDKAAYKAFFNKAMKKFGINDITDLKGDKKKEFFDYVDANWKADNEVEESTQIDEAKLKPGKGKVTIDIDYAGDNPKQVERSFKVKLKKKGKYGYELSGEKKDVLAYLKSNWSAAKHAAKAANAWDAAHDADAADEAAKAAEAAWAKYIKLKKSTQIDEAKLKAGKGKVTIEIDYAGDNPKQVEQSFKVKLKKTGKDGYDLSGEKKNVLAYLQSKDYDMDPEDIEDLFPELLESTQIDETKRMKYDKVIKKLEDGDWESSYDVVPRKHLIYIDTKTGKQHSIFVESTSKSTIE